MTRGVWLNMTLLPFRAMPRHFLNMTLWPFRAMPRDFLRATSLETDASVSVASKLQGIRDSLMQPKVLHSNFGTNATGGENIV